MSELAGGGVATVPCPFAPVLAEWFPPHASSLLLPFAFTLSVAAASPAFLRAPALLPEPFRSVPVNFSFLSFAGGISGAVALHSTSVTALIPWARLSVPVHDGEARVTLLPTFLVHFYPAPFRKLPGIDEFKTKLCIVRKVVSSIVCSSVVLAVSYSI